MLRYAITDRTKFPGDERARRRALISQARRLAGARVDFLQLREKDLPRSELVSLARTLHTECSARGSSSGVRHRTRLLLNGGGLVPFAGDPPRECALLLNLLRDSTADGLHLPSGWTAAHIFDLRRSGIGRPLLPLAQPPPPQLLSVACHTVAECATAARAGADLLLFSPVFHKQSAASDRPLAGAGTAALRQAVLAAAPTPVLALGGVTVDTVAECLATGAAGIAAIRLFLGDPAPLAREP